jgi:hypothetical protein
MEKRKMKKILLTSVYVGIFFEASTHKIMAENYSKFACPDLAQISVYQINNQYRWISLLFPGTWKGPGGAHVDAFLEATITTNGANSEITCYYKTDNNVTSKNKNEKTAKEAPPPPLKYGTVGIAVAKNTCKFLNSPKESSCKDSRDNCNIKCKQLDFQYKCPDPSYLIKHCNTPPGTGWSWTGGCPDKTLHLETLYNEGIEISGLSWATCYYADQNYDYQANHQFSDDLKCYFSIPTNNDVQFCNDIDKCIIHCKRPFE